MAVDTSARVTDNWLPEPCRGPMNLNGAIIRAHLSLRLTCALTAPTNPTLVKAGAPLTLMATTAVLEGTHVVQKVEFYRGDVKLGDDVAAPYAYVWSSVPAGTHMVRPGPPTVRG